MHSVRINNRGCLDLPSQYRSPPSSSKLPLKIIKPGLISGAPTLKGSSEKIGAGMIIQILKQNPTKSRSPKIHVLTVFTTYLICEVFAVILD